MITKELISLLLALWGAGLSTILTFIKFYEVRKNLFRLEVTYNFRSIPHLGHDITILNMSAKYPVVIIYWELYTQSECWFKKNRYVFESAEDECQIKIDPYHTKTLNFIDENYFDLNKSEILKNKKIFIKLYITGRKSVQKLVYSPYSKHLAD